VRDRGLVHAVLMGYGELVPRGRYPSAVVFVEVEDGAVDVNVHPQKLEVRFSDAQRVYAAVRHVVGAAVARAPWLELESAGAADGAAGTTLQAMAEASPSGGGRSGRATEVARDYAARLARSLFSWRAEGTPPGGVGLRGPAVAVVEWTGTGTGTETGTGTGTETGTETGTGRGEGFFSGLRYLGQIDLTYLVCERDGEMVLVDQHAAHERVAFQTIKERHRQRALPRQRLLFPQTVELEGALAAAAIDAGDALDAIGFEVELFGGQSFAVKAVPAELSPGQDPLALLRQVLAELGENGGTRALEERLDAVFATLACHSVVRAGDVLAPAEVIALFAALDRVDFRAHCPHGRPVLLRIRVDEIARRFGRS
jgi:DNA mismatch repair protein MutL